MENYKYIEILVKRPGILDCRMTQPMPCSTAYFTQAFWMPIKHQIGERVVLLMKDNGSISLVYNALAAIGDYRKMTMEQAKFCEEDSIRVFNVALRHIDNVMGFFYEDERNRIGFLDEANPIEKIVNESIQMTGRLPMQEAYFLDQYWKPKANKLHKKYKGVRFRLRFTNAGSVVTVIVEFCKEQALCRQMGIPFKEDPKKKAFLCGLATSELTEAITAAAAEYATALV